MKHIFLIILLLFAFDSNAKGVSRSMNNKLISFDSIHDYSFIVSGHFYGGRSNQTGFPVNTILANLDWINRSNCTMLISLGDLFMDIKNDIPNYNISFFEKLKIPIFNAVGNHDISSDVYQTNFGKTFFYFQINNDIHLVLDTELNDGSIKDEQFQLIKEVDRLVEDHSSIKNVFIYSHRTIWARSYSDLDRFFTDNTQSLFGNNFTAVVLPVLKSMQKKVQVTMFSGSLGSAPASFFNYMSKDSIQYIATAIRGLKRDAVLVVSSHDSKVEFDVKSLTNQSINKFESYNLEFWNSNFGKKEEFNYRLIPLKVKNILMSIDFWLGIAFVLLSIVAVKLIRNLRNEK
jgi:hypothetical protein